MRLSWPAVLSLLISSMLFAQDYPQTNSPSTSSPHAKPHVFITDSQSWESRGSAGGSGGSWAAESHGGARPQTAEIIKTFGERCPQVMVNNRPSIADYVVVLDHEGGKSYLSHRNKVAVFQAVSGDVVMSHSTLSLGNSVKDACEGIEKDWAQHGAELRGAAAKQVSPSSTASTLPPAAPNPSASAPKVTIASTPEGADIEIDGSFVGNTPSSIEVTPGDHQVVVKKSSYKPWERKLKVTNGDIKLNAELEQGSNGPAPVRSSNPNTNSPPNVADVQPGPSQQHTPNQATQMATVEVSSIPPGADIEIDNRPAGKTPMTISVPAGEHVITIRKKDFRTWQKSIKVTSADVRVNTQLQQVSATLH
jgi:hypothetical protein